MIPAEFVALLFSAASMQRWNDHPRPIPLTELDKQAHKAAIAWLLAELEAPEASMREELIVGLIAEALHRLVLTDLKAPIFHRLMASHGQEVTRWALDKLAPLIEPIAQGKLYKAVAAYLDLPEHHPIKRLIAAAHYRATAWEFRFIAHAAPFLFGIERTQAEIAEALDGFSDLTSVQALQASPALQGFLDLVGQLRFQERWAHTPRVPRSSVLGHLFFVAVLSYALILELGAQSRARRCHLFWAALFHDLPEVLTRDVISPIKREAPGLEALLEELEAQAIDEELCALLPAHLCERLRYYLTDLYLCRIRDHAGVRFLENTLLIPAEFDSDALNPLDAPLIKIADELAALTEAAQSLALGIRPQALWQCNTELVHKYKGVAIKDLDIGELFARVAFSPCASDFKAL